MTKAGNVYFFTSDDGMYVKIGWAIDTRRRMSEIQTSNPLGMVNFFQFVTDRESERLLHKFFKPVRVRGEWFTWLPMLEDLIEEIEVAQDDLTVLPDPSVGIEAILDAIYAADKQFVPSIRIKSILSHLGSHNLAPVDSGDRSS